MSRKKILSLSAFFLALALPVLAASYQFTTIVPPGSAVTSAQGINNVGDVIGSTETSGGIESGYVRHHGKYFFLNVPGATDTDGNGINNTGDVVGTWDVYTPTTGVNHGYVGSEDEFILLPDPPNQDGFPDFSAINDKDVVVGNLFPQPSTTNNGNRGFVFEDGTYTILDCSKDQTEANGINNDGDIVGECTDFLPAYHEHGFLLDDGKYYLIDYPGATDTVAYSINEHGTIAGTYTDSSGVDHGFVLKDFPEKPKWQTVDAPGAQDTKVAAINENDTLAGTVTNSPDINTGFKATKK
jgi:uncharacterized membrane protein